MSTTTLEPAERDLIRAWALSNDITLGKGKIPQAVVDACLKDDPRLAGKYYQPRKPKRTLKPMTPVEQPPALTTAVEREPAVDEPTTDAGFEVFKAAPPAPAVVRAWAHANGIDVNTRGNVRTDVMNAYLEAHPTDAAQPLAESSQDRMPEPNTADAPSDSPTTTVEPDDAGRREEMGHPTSIDAEHLVDAETPAPAVWEIPLVGERARPRYDDGVGIVRDVDVALKRVRVSWLPDAHDTETTDAEILEQCSDWLRWDRFTFDDMYDGAFAELARTTPAPELGLAPIDIAHRSDMLDQTRDRINEHRPDWAAVTISQDVERARGIAVRLEQELAETERRLHIAETSLELVLRKWDEATGALRLTTDLLQDAEHDRAAAVETIDMLYYHLDSAHARIERLLDQQEQRRGILGRRRAVRQ